MCGQHNVRASAEENTGQNTDNGHTPNPRTEIKIPDNTGQNTDKGHTPNPRKEIKIPDNTGQNTDKGHTPNPRTEIKIPDPAGNRTRAAGLEGRDYRPCHGDRYLYNVN